MDRRTFLRRVGVAAAGATTSSALVACGGEPDVEEGAAGPIGATGDGRATGAAGGGGATGIPDTPPTLSVLQSSFEVLTGAARWITFGVRDIDNEELADADVQVYLRSAEPPSTEGTAEREVLAGPLDAQYSPIEGTGIGVYWVQADIEDPGFVEIVAVAGEDHGAATVQARAPEESDVPAPGDPAVAAPTPTEEDDLGYFAVCTQDPPCGMHEMSLDEALATGRPVVLLFATPQFCQTVVCGPAVATVDAVRQDGDWGETIFVHSEIYAEDPSGNLQTATLVEAVEQWALPSEPWFFAIDAEGTVVDRLDGPMVPDIVRTMLEDLGA